ncbi:hypothetical protein C0995_004149, partial [Termitomyces sp. Mi166
MEKRVEIQATQAQESCHSKLLKEQLELCDLEAQQMVKATKIPNKGIELLPHDDDPSLAQVLAMGTKSPMNREHGEVQMRAHILQEYKKDQMYVAILNKLKEHSQFMIEWKLIYTVNTEGAK